MTRILKLHTTKVHGQDAALVIDTSFQHCSPLVDSIWHSEACALADWLVTTFQTQTIDALIKVLEKKQNPEHWDIQQMFDRWKPWGRNPEITRKGHIFNGDGLSVSLMVSDHLPGFKEVPDWADSGFRLVWVNPEKRATFTYCEGDLILVICPDDETFAAEIKYAEEYYGKPMKFAEGSCVES